MSPEPADDSAPTTLPWPWPAPTPTAAEPARPDPDRPTLNLLGLILTGLAHSSWVGYTRDFQAFARFVGEPTAEAGLGRLFRQPQPVANALALAYHADMAGKGLSAATISRRLAALRRAVRRARIAGLCSISLDEIESPRAASHKDVSGPGVKGWRALLDQAEADAGTGTAKGARDLALILLLHDRALRRGEAVGIDFPGDLDLTRPAVAIVGKGKTAREWVTINDRTRAALARWVERRGDWPGPLFVRTDQAAKVRTRLTGMGVWQMVRALAERAGLARAVRPHGLRHQAITEALDGGWDVRDVKQFSRHAKIDTVLIYDDRRKDVAGDITRSLGRPRRGGRKSA